MEPRHLQKDIVTGTKMKIDLRKDLEELFEQVKDTKVKENYSSNPELFYSVQRISYTTAESVS